jgi:hypothetical protein
MKYGVIFEVKDVVNKVFPGFNNVIEQMNVSF